MYRQIARGLTLGIFVSMYLLMELALFKMLGIKGGLAVSFYFMPFGIVSIIGFMYRVPDINIEEEVGATNYNSEILND